MSRSAVSSMSIGVSYPLSTAEWRSGDGRRGRGVFGRVAAAAVVAVRVNAAASVAIWASIISNLIASVDVIAIGFMITSRVAL